MVYRKCGGMVKITYRLHPGHSGGACVARVAGFIQVLDEMGFPPSAFTALDPTQLPFDPCVT